MSAGFHPVSSVFVFLPSLFRKAIEGSIKPSANMRKMVIGMWRFTQRTHALTAAGEALWRKGRQRDNTDSEFGQNEHKLRITGCVIDQG